MARNSTYQTVAVDGDKELFAILQQFPRQMQLKILEQAVKRAAAPGVRLAKRHAARSKRTGALQKSIKARVRMYKGNVTAVAIIGPDRGRYGAGKRLKKGDDMRQSHMPAKYAHLVEFGHYSRAGTGTQVKSAKGTKRKEGTFKANSFVLPQPFMRPAFLGSKSQIEADVPKFIRLELDKLRAKSIKSGSHKA